MSCPARPWLPSRGRGSIACAAGSYTWLIADIVTVEGGGRAAIDRGRRGVFRQRFGRYPRALDQDAGLRQGRVHWLIADQVTTEAIGGTTYIMPCAGGNYTWAIADIVTTEQTPSNTTYFITASTGAT